MGSRICAYAATGAIVGGTYAFLQNESGELSAQNHLILQDLAMEDMEAVLLDRDCELMLTNLRLYDVNEHTHKCFVEIVRQTHVLIKHDIAFSTGNVENAHLHRVVMNCCLCNERIKNACKGFSCEYVQYCGDTLSTDDYDDLAQAFERVTTKCQNIYKNALSTVT